MIVRVKVDNEGKAYFLIIFRASQRMGCIVRTQLRGNWRARLMRGNSQGRCSNVVLFYDLTKYLKKKYQNFAYSISFFCVFLRFCRVQRHYQMKFRYPNEYTYSKREVLYINHFPLVVFLRKKFSCAEKYSKGIPTPYRRDNNSASISARLNIILNSKFLINTPLLPLRCRSCHHER